MRKLLALSLALSLPLVASAQAAPPAEAPKAAPAITVTPYGIIQAGLYKNDGLFGAYSGTNILNPSISNSADYPNYARSEQEGEFIGSVRQTRVGVNAAVPLENVIGAAVAGKVEFDFMGPGAANWNSSPLRLRHAYLTSDWSFGADKLFVLFGQTDALVNALHPESTSYLANPLFQQAGNLHRRTPQLRVGYNLGLDAVALKLEAGILSPADSDAQTVVTSPSTGPTAVDYGAGNRSGQPEYEARLGVTVKPIAGFGGTVGVGYATNTRAYNGVGYAVTNSTTEKVTASLIGVDAVIDLTEYAQVRGEWFQNKGMDDTFSGIASSNVAGAAGARKPVESSGYWAQAIIKPIPAIWILAGLGQEKVDAATYAAATANSMERLQNDMIHGGLTFNMNKAWKVGLEYVQTTTKSRAGLTATPELKASQMSLSTQLKF